MLAIYTRLSKEDKDSTSIQNQIREGKAFASKLKLSYKLYNEGEGISGGADIKERPQLFSLLQDIRSGVIDACWFRSQNRLERNSSTYAIFISEAQKFKVDVYFNDKLLDFNNPSDNLLGTITSAVNQYQKDLQSVQTKRTLIDNIKEGKVWSVVAYGYKSEKGILTIDEEESLIVKRIFSESLKGVGTRKIAETLTDEGVLTRYNKIGKGVLRKTNKHTKKTSISKTEDIIWNGNTIRNIIKNSLYKGERKFSGNIYEAPIIINPILWQKVNDNLKRNRNNSGKRVEHKYLLKGKLICAKCGRNYYGRRRVSLKDNFYMCSSKRIKNKNCGNRSINITVLENFIWKRFFADKKLQTIVDRFFKQTDVGLKIADIEKEFNGLTNEISNLDSEEKNAIRLALKNLLNDEDLETQLTRIKRTKNEIEIKLTKLTEQKFFYKDSTIKKLELEKDLKVSKDISFNDKRELISKYIKSIEIQFVDSFYILRVDFNVQDLDVENYVIDRQYNIAVDVCDNIIIPLSEKSKNYSKEELKIKGKEIESRLYKFNSYMDISGGHRLLFEGHYKLTEEERLNLEKNPYYNI